MGKNANFVSHKKSKLKENGGPKLPLASDIVEGEIAINFGKDVETLSIKNESGDVVTFSSDNYYTEKKLGSGFTGENSGVTVTDAILWASGTGLNSVVLKGSSGTASGNYSVAEGYQTSATSADAHAEGSTTLASGYTSHAEGGTTKAGGDYSHAEGVGTIAIGNYAHSEGNGTEANGDSSHAEGEYTEANGDYSHAEGSDTKASGESSHAEGSTTEANGDYSHAEGDTTRANGDSSHAEGDSTVASGDSSHAEGYYTSAFTNYSHAEGWGSKASGESSHAEGHYSIANGLYSHAEGNYTSAMTHNSHTEGLYTIANNQSEHASGEYNVSNSASTTFGDSGNTLFSVGNGTSVNTRHNAFEIRQNGDIYIVSGSSDIKLQDYIGGNITVDQVLDDTTSASTNPVSSKAVYSAMTENELVWTNAFVAMSGTVSAHTADTVIHVTQADKDRWDSDSIPSSAVTSMTGYSVAASGTPISTSDTLNEAIGKLEKMINDLRNYVSVIESIDDRLQTVEGIIEDS